MKTQFDKLLSTGKVRKNVDLFPFLSMRLHTKASYLFEATSRDDLVCSLQAAHTLALPAVIMGGGSNMVFKGSIIPGLVILNLYSEITTLAETDKTIDLCIGSGTPMSVVILYSVKHGLSGLEQHKGLPGTVGGALYMNSKWTRPPSYVGDMLVGAEIIDRKGHVRRVDRDYFHFSYDYSKLQDTKEILLTATFRLQKKTVHEVAKNADESFAYRKKTQPFGVATCGCFFQNITPEQQKQLNVPTRSVGYLIDQVGLKGVKVGSFTVSSVHANFITNEGGDAHPEDLSTLVENIKERVRAKYGVELKEEVQIF
ncbi:MAG: UDP-N-acetylmuramate dehydrogenase [bacterium]